jgi:hypothetical protein
VEDFSRLSAFPAVSVGMFFPGPTAAMAVPESSFVAAVSETLGDCFPWRRTYPGGNLGKEEMPTLTSQRLALDGMFRLEWKGLNSPRGGGRKWTLAELFFYGNAGRFSVCLVIFFDNLIFYLNKIIAFLILKNFNPGIPQPFL